jgi:hypothetical protein
VDAAHFKELLLDAHIQRRKVLQSKDRATTKVDYLSWFTGTVARSEPKISD